MPALPQGITPYRNQGARVTSPYRVTLRSPSSWRVSPSAAAMLRTLTVMVKGGCGTPPLR